MNDLICLNVNLNWPGRQIYSIKLENLLHASKKRWEVETKCNSTLGNSNGYPLVKITYSIWEDNYNKSGTVFFPQFWESIAFTFANQLGSEKTEMNTL